MAEQSSSEKTEKPTPKKLREARKKGQVAKSNDVVSTALLVGLFLLFTGFWYTDFVHLADFITLPTKYFNKPFDQALDILGTASFIFYLKVVAPFLAVVTSLAIFVNFVQTGPVLSGEPLKPKIEKLNPIEGAKKIFSLKNIIEFVKNVLKTIVLGVMVFVVLRSMIGVLLVAPSGGLEAVIALIGPMFVRFIWPIVIVYIAFAVADYFFQKYNFMREMRMTKDEVKREYKESEGNPEIKGKRKKLARELILEDAKEKTKQATVLVTNPTHYAVALFYPHGRKTLPIVTAKGKGFIAQQMIETARKEGIPIMRNVMLARDLYKRVDVNHFIPDDMLAPVAEVIKWVQKIKREEERQHR